MVVFNLGNINENCVFTYTWSKFVVKYCDMFLIYLINKKIIKQ